MKPLTLEETALKEEMKERCLAKGQYIDEKAKDKFKMLCHLEDFEIQYWELQQENKQLKDNWNKLKEYIEKDYGFYDKLIAPEYGCAMGALRRIKDKMHKLEQGSDNNE